MVIPILGMMILVKLPISYLESSMKKKELFFILKAKLYSRFHKYNDNEAEFFHKELNASLP